MITVLKKLRVNNREDFIDTKTVEFYNEQAQELEKFHRDLEPIRLYELIQKFFHKNELTLDLGCGIGRDTFWLFKQGYKVLGLDASESMLEIAKKHYSQLDFVLDSLPELSSQKDESYFNVFCSAVLMHVPEQKIKCAIDNILRITKPDGKILISLRAGENGDIRENGKLYTKIIPENLIDHADNLGGKLLLRVENYEETRQITWHSFVFQKSK